MHSIKGFYPVLPLVGDVDSGLTGELYVMRNVLHAERQSDDVIVRPVHEGYGPQIDIIGRMQVGHIGLMDFKDRFRGLQVAGVDPSELYVGYMGLRHLLDEMYTEDESFREDLRRAAIRTKREGAFGGKSIPATIVTLLGSQAADIAIERQAKKSVQKKLIRREDDLTARIKYAAEARLPKLPAEQQKGRLRAKTDFIRQLTPGALEMTRHAIALAVNRR